MMTFASFGNLPSLSSNCCEIKLKVCNWQKRTIVSKPWKGRHQNKKNKSCVIVRGEKFSRSVTLAVGEPLLFGLCDFLWRKYCIEIHTSESELFRAIPESVSEPFRVIPNQSENPKIRGINLNESKLKLIQTEFLIRMSPRLQWFGLFLIETLVWIHPWRIDSDWKLGSDSFGLILDRFSSNEKQNVFGLDRKQIPEWLRIALILDSLKLACRDVKLRVTLLFQCL